MSNEKTLGSVYQQLCDPLPLKSHEVKPGATTKDGGRALVLVFADMRAYQARLDEVVGPDGWSVAYSPLSETVTYCTLTLLGVSRSDVGECHKTDRDGDPDENRACSAVAQAFKRACASFGLGRYLYSLPQPWEEYDSQKRRFVEPVSSIVRKVFKDAGMLPLDRLYRRLEEIKKAGSSPSELDAFGALCRATCLEGDLGKEEAQTLSIALQKARGKAA